MKLRMAWLAILCLVLAAVPAWGTWDYANGHINGTTDAWYINFGYIVSDTFVAGGPNAIEFWVGVWEYPGDGGSMTSLQWSITSGENGGTVYGSGTAKGSNLTDRFISTNQYGYSIDLVTVSGLNVATRNGTTYWLNLQNAAVPSGDPVLWDEEQRRMASPVCPMRNLSRRGLPVAGLRKCRRHDSLGSFHDQRLQWLQLSE